MKPFASCMRCVLLLVCFCLLTFTFAHAQSIDSNQIFTASDGVVEFPCVLVPTNKSAGTDEVVLQGRAIFINSDLVVEVAPDYIRTLKRSRRRARRRGKKRRARVISSKIRSFRNRDTICKQYGVLPGDGSNDNNTTPPIGDNPFPPSPQPTPEVPVEPPAEPVLVSCGAKAILEYCEGDSGFFPSCREVNPVGIGESFNPNEAASLALQECSSSVTSWIITGNTGGDTVRILQSCELTFCG